tara:strand:+ start:391 stop:543 length:153 start_codon:yes stop_codon:yes gene_type:complete
MNSADILTVCVLNQEKDIIMSVKEPSEEDKKILKWLNKRIQRIEDSYLDL